MEKAVLIRGRIQRANQRNAKTEIIAEDERFCQDINRQRELSQCKPVLQRNYSKRADKAISLKKFYKNEILVPVLVPEDIEGLEDYYNDPEKQIKIFLELHKYLSKYYKFEDVNEKAGYIEAMHQILHAMENLFPFQDFTLIHFKDFKIIEMKSYMSFEDELKFDIFYFDLRKIDSLRNKKMFKWHFKAFKIAMNILIKVGVPSPMQGEFGYMTKYYIAEEVNNSNEEEQSVLETIKNEMKIYGNDIVKKIKKTSISEKNIKSCLKNAKSKEIKELMELCLKVIKKPWVLNGLDDYNEFCDPFLYLQGRFIIYPNDLNQVIENAMNHHFNMCSDSGASLEPPLVFHNYMRAMNIDRYQHVKDCLKLIQETSIKLSRCN